MTNPMDIRPLVDAGSDTLARYHYQAEVILPYCLACALGDEIITVIPEHLEDVALETSDKWRFIQVKTKDPETGLWKLSNLLGPGGALNSLHRTFQQTREAKIQLELILEGTPSRDNPIQCLKFNGDHEDTKLISEVSKALKITTTDASEFISHVILGKSPAPRQNIMATNIQLLYAQNRELTYTEVDSIYERLVAEIERAMRAEQLGPEWPRYIINPANDVSEEARKLAAKKLTKVRLREIVKPLLSPEKQLLKRITDSTSESISLLERKLANGGATKEIINSAGRLHANAQSYIFSRQAMSMYSSEAPIEDLNVRLETYVSAKNALYKSSPTPAIETWNALLGEFTANPSKIDPNNIMKADPMLLLGQVCELADSCLVDWGIANAR